MTTTTTTTTSPLTRHLYVAEEVEAALSYVCSGRNDPQQAVFWCQELLHSGYGSETVSLLFRTWLWQKGPFGLRWLLDASPLADAETTEDAILLAADRLRAMYALRDHSLWHLLVLESEPLAPTDRLTMRPLPAALPTALSAASATLFFRACHQHKARTAWYLARSYSSAELMGYAQQWIDHVLPADLRPPVRQVCDLLTDYPGWLGYASEEYDRALRCLVVCILCMTTDALRRSLSLPVGVAAAAPTMDPVAARFLEELADDYGCQRFRRFAIPTAALYGITARGRMPWTMNTYAALNHFESHLTGCPYWDEIGAGSSLDELGRFTDVTLYDVYLVPESAMANVPDEWTRAEKQKSHGEGVLSPKETVSVEKYVRLTLARRARLAWNTTEHMLRVVKGQGRSVCDPEDILRALRGAQVPLEEVTPCRRTWKVHS